MARARCSVAHTGNRATFHSDSSDSAMILLGWREWVALPALGIDAVRAKVDTGARSSALHVDAQWRYSDGGAPWVGFRLRPSWRGTRVIEAHAPVHRRARGDRFRRPPHPARVPPHHAAPGRASSAD